MAGNGDERKGKRNRSSQNEREGKESIERESHKNGNKIKTCEREGEREKLRKNAERGEREKLRMQRERELLLSIPHNYHQSEFSCLVNYYYYYYSFLPSLICFSFCQNLHCFGCGGSC